MRWSCDLRVFCASGRVDVGGEWGKGGDEVLYVWGEENGIGMGKCEGVICGMKTGRVKVEG